MQLNSPRPVVRDVSSRAPGMGEFGSPQRREVLPPEEEAREGGKEKRKEQVRNTHTHTT